MFLKLVFGDFIYKVNISNINCLFFLFSYVKLFDNCAKFFKLIPFFFRFISAFENGITFRDKRS